MIRFKQFLAEGSTKKYLNMFFGERPPMSDAKIKRLGVKIPELDWSSQQQTIIKDTIKWARNTLKKEDKVIWYLRWFRMSFIYQEGVGKGDHHNSQKILYAYMADYNKKTRGTKITSGTSALASADYKTLQQRLQHFMDLPIPNIGKYRFEWKMPTQVISDLTELENEWKKGSGGAVETKATEFLHIDGQYSWYDLEDNTCREEAEMMGHCSTGPPNTTILSLREKIKKKKKVFYRSRLTFIYDKQGNIGESKGHGNKRPTEKYHKYIIKLLQDKRIKGIMGGGYLPEENFSVADLPPEIRDKLIKDKPDLMDKSGLLRLLQKKYDKNWMGRLMKDFGKKYLKAQDRVVLTELSWDQLIRLHFPSQHKGLNKFLKDLPTNMSMRDVPHDQRSIGAALTSKQEDRILDYLAVHHEDWGDDFRSPMAAFADLEEPLFAEMVQVFLKAHYIGESEIFFQHLNKALGDIRVDKAAGDHEGLDIILKPNKYSGDIDEKVLILGDGEKIVKSLMKNREDTYHLDNLLNRPNFLIPYDEPRGYGGFDQEHWETGIKKILKKLK